jgi:RNA polymerase sigma factor (sigma-70 family)
MENCEKMLEKYDNLIQRSARKYKVDGYTYEDILQEFRMLFFSVCQIYDENGGAKITTLYFRYIRWWIEFKLRTINAEKRPKLVFIDDGEINRINSSSINNPCEVYEKQVNDDFVMSMFKRIPNSEITYRHIINGESLTTIAKELSISVQAVYVKHKTVLEKFRTILQEELN